MVRWAEMFSHCCVSTGGDHEDIIPSTVGHLEASQRDPASESQEPCAAEDIPVEEKKAPVEEAVLFSSESHQLELDTNESRQLNRSDSELAGGPDPKRQSREDNIGDTQAKVLKFQSDRQAARKAHFHAMANVSLTLVFLGLVLLVVGAAAWTSLVNNS